MPIYTGHGLGRDVDPALNAMLGNCAQCMSHSYILGLTYQVDQSRCRRFKLFADGTRLGTAAPAKEAFCGR